MNKDNKGILKKRQLQILKYAAEGLTEAGIALELSISINTVKYHKKKIYRQLQVHSLIEAVIIALKKKLIVLEDLKAGEKKSDI